MKKCKDCWYYLICKDDNANNCNFYALWEDVCSGKVSIDEVIPF